MDLTELYDLLTTLPVNGMVTVNNDGVCPWLSITQNHDSKTGSGNSGSLKLRTVYSVFPWSADPSVPVLYFEVYRYKAHSELLESWNEFDQDIEEENEKEEIDFKFETENNHEKEGIITDITTVIEELVSDLYTSQLTFSRFRSSHSSASFSTSDVSELPLVPSISQGEHPLTGMPTFYLHPCNTRSFLQLIDSLQENKSWVPAEKLYIWLQTFGSVVSLDLPSLDSCK